ncbi:MAG: TetR/AcrR family transcriptional regulator [Hyphomicrobiaceae bacterium]
MNGVKKVRVQRKPRVDGQRNRDMILEAAHRILVEKGATASLDEIAQAAGVGNGTLYRHFPTRVALVAEVCRLDTRPLVEAAGHLSASQSPITALARWLEMFIDYMSEKAIVAEAVSALISPSSDIHGSSGAHVRGALTTLFERAREDGSLAVEIDPLDLLRAVAGIASIAPKEDWRPAAKHMASLVLQGLGRGSGHTERRVQP